MLHVFQRCLKAGKPFLRSLESAQPPFLWVKLYYVKP
jgi:hypothetical protein